MQLCIVISIDVLKEGIDCLMELLWCIIILGIQYFFFCEFPKPFYDIEVG